MSKIIAIQSRASAPAATLDMAALRRQLGTAKEALDAGKAAREAARSERAKSKGKEPVDAEAAKADRRRAADNARAMTKLLVPLASIGAKDAIAKAYDEGASPKAYEKGLTPTMAAIERGHLDLARWLIARPGHLWLDQIHSRNTYNEFSAAVASDSVEMAKELQAARPSLAGSATGSIHWNIGLFELAMQRAPKCAAWIIQSRMVGKLAVARGRGNATSAYGLANSLRSSDFATAKTLFEHLRPHFQSGPLRPDGIEHELVEALLRADDAEGLAWVLAQDSSLAQSAMEGVQGSAGCSYSHWLGYGDAANSALEARLNAKSMTGTGRSGLLSTLPSFAACQGAAECLELLLNVKDFRGQVPLMQERPDQYAWESPLISVNDPAIVEALQGAGFDFERRMADGWNHLGAIVGSGKATVKWLEFIGKKLPGLLAPIPADQAPAPALAGKTAFEMAGSLRNPPQSLPKWRAICEKASIRAGSGRARQTKEVKEKSKPRRL